MSRFVPIPNGSALLFSRGLFREADLFSRDGAVYAKWQTGFVKLGGGSLTSLPAVSYADLQGDGIELSRGGHPKVKT